jgi:hypothetical protein
MNRFNANTVTAALVYAASTIPAHATPDDAPRAIEAMVAEADLVFRGQVVNIEYALSKPTGPDGARIPHTFVTYEILEEFQGDASDRVTLRFLGGFSHRNGLYLDTCVTPRFDIGDEDVLFVKDNTDAFCPLVGETDGRLRIIDGQVYTESGHEIALDQEGALSIGPRHLLEEVITQDVMGTVTVMNLGPEAVTGPSGAALIDDLVDEIARAAARNPAPAQAFLDADPAVPFDGPDMTPAAPPAPRLADGETVSNPRSNEGFRPSKR